MYNVIRLFSALLIILVITPQTEKENILIKKFHESGMFINYAEAKKVLKSITWCFTFIFFIIGLF
jgi:preprotein translocase subunit SecG